ncbi:unnamed protein product [Sphenostylis stenocarpa]|uniref:Uncharacterized protein n=1 Tax=Sphenostylis stenocarpa TaxID=92480 RepID=A0AA86TPA0_9FABA|nr:unnamed protein product [Sphenostylis stenocarpa]
MEAVKEKMKEDKQMSNLDVVSYSMSESCRCNELEERSKIAEMRCAELEFKLQKKDEQCEALEAKLCALEGEVEVLRVSSECLKEKKVAIVKKGEVDTAIDLTDDNEVEQLMIENSVLECEKKTAESEVQVWKDKYRKLESWASQLKLESGSYYHEENGKEESNVIRTGSSSHLEPIIDSKVLCVERVKRQLTFEIGESPSKRMAPSTPFVAKSASVVVIDIVDSDDEPIIAQHPVLDSHGSRNILVSSCFATENAKMSSSYPQNNEEDRNSGEDLPFVVTPKRKRNCNVVTSESERDDDDDVPNCKFERMHIQEGSPDKVRCDTNNSVAASTSADYKVTGTVTPKQRLMPLRKLAKKGQEGADTSSKAKHQLSNPTDDDNVSQDDLSDCEDESLNDFIVDDFDELSCDDDTSSKSEDVPDNHMDDSRDVSDEDMNFSKIISQIHRRKDHMEWEFEADMLSAFGKDSQLCMKAVCALYRQQTSEEQMSRGTLYTNQRGFSKFDAHRGSTLAEFLTHGDPGGGLKKSVKELQEHDPMAVELCRNFAIRYSKQLYQIYKNKENPFFP